MRAIVLFIALLFFSCTSTKRVIDARASSEVDMWIRAERRDTAAINREERRDIVTIVETETTTTQYGDAKTGDSFDEDATMPVRQTVTNCHRLIKVDRSVISELKRTASMDTTASATRYASNEQAYISESAKPANGAVFRFFVRLVLLVFFCSIFWIYRKTIIKFLLR